MYSLDHFITKFEAIPEGNWCIRHQTNALGQHCAYGHVGGSVSSEGERLTSILRSIPGLKPVEGAQFPVYVSTPARINNGDVLNYQQATPKQRILAALYDLKANEAVEVAQNIVNQPVAELV